MKYQRVTHIKIPLSLLASLGLIAFWLVGAASAAPPSASDVFSGYRLNASYFAKVRITWRYSLKNTDAFYNADKRMAQILELKAKSADISGERKTKLLRAAKGFRSSSEGTPRETVFLQDYWTDGLRKQVRIPASQLDLAAARVWQFPDAPVTPDSLIVSYKDTCILSYNPQANATLRIWAGYQPNTKANSSVRSAPLEEYYYGFLYPPCVEGKHAVKQQYLHPVDRFFSLPVQNIHVVGSVELDGVKALKLVHRTIEKSTLHAADGAKLEYLNTTTAFVDPARGYIPVRIEYRSDKLVNGECVDAATGDPFLIVRCSAVKAVDGVAFYPMEGVEEIYGAEPSSPQYGKPQTPESFRSKGQIMPSAMYHENTWSISRLDRTPVMSDVMYELEFPDKTIHGTRGKRELQENAQLGSIR